VDRLVEEMSAFLLAGRGWLVEHVNHADKLVRVREAPRGQKPAWGGYVPALLGFDLCQRMKRVLTDVEPVPYVDAAGMHALQARREELGDTLRRPLALQDDDGVLRWWTFAGGKINHTLKYALEVSREWKVVADNFELRISGPGVSDGAVRAAAAEMAGAAFWEKPDTRRALLAKLPGYRLSKFQEALPEEFAVEMVGNFLLDIAAARRFLEEAVRGSQARSE
jgi:ATP-dependent helicase Lhr and Lhr-like helicase